MLKPQKFSVGNHVLMRHENKLSLEFNWKGPFKVIAVNPDTDIYQLQDLNGQTYSSWVHIDRLKTIHIKSPVTSDSWYNPTAVRAAKRHDLQAADHLALLSEDVQQSEEGILS